MNRAVAIAMSLLCSTIFMLGCSAPEPVIGPLSRQLVTGMTTSDVASIFINCRILTQGKWTLDGDPADLQFATKIYRPGAECATWVTYFAKGDSCFLSIPETCKVYFAGDGVIIAYRYEPARG